MNTPAIFGHYIDVYDISRAVEDHATVPIYYESRLARIELDEDEKPKIDDEIAALTEDDAEEEQERIKRKWSTVEALVGSEKRLALVAEDLVKHFEDRVAAADTSPQARLSIMAGAIEWVLDMQQNAAAKAETEEDKKRAHRRYGDAVLALSKAFALAAASDGAREIREEVGFFQAIRAALVKSSATNGRGKADRELAIQQLISRAVVSTEIIDIMRAAGIKSPDISILSDDFLAEVRAIEQKNLALEALKKLINGEIRSQSKRNIVLGRSFSERLQDAIARYHANAISTVQVLEELIKMAKDIRAARQRGEESGLSDEEYAFYLALAENESAREVMGEPKLLVIAHVLVEKVRGNVTVDWMHMESARTRMRILVKKILKEYGYPPDLQDAAVQTVLQQAEALSVEWAAL